MVACFVSSQNEASDEAAADIMVLLVVINQPSWLRCGGCEAGEDGAQITILLFALLALSCFLNRA